MIKQRRVWLSEQAYRKAKMEAAREGIKMYEYLDKALCSAKKEDKDTRRKYNFF